MATDIQKIGQTVLAQMGVVAGQAARSAVLAQQAAAETTDKAPLASPAFTGTPTAPTPADLDNSTKLSTTAYLDRLRGVASGLATLDNTGKVPSAQIPQISVVAVVTVASQAAMLALSATPGTFAIRTDISNAVFILQQLPASTLGNWYQIGTAPVLSVAGLTGAIVAADLLAAILAAPLASPALTGAPTAPTVAGTVDNTTKIATTAFVQAVRALLAPLASPTFSGTPVVPTAVADTNTGQIASTAFVLGQLSQVADGVPAIDGTAARGTSTRAARADHVHPTDTSRAPVDSPLFTGTPAAPTPGSNINTTQIPTTAWANTYFTARANNLSDLASVATARTNLGLGTAAVLDTGTSANKIVKLDGSAKLPAIDGSQLTNLPPQALVNSSGICPVGWAALCVAAAPVPDGGTTDGSNIHFGYIDSSGTPSILGPAQTGTWKNVSGIGTAVFGVFVRIA